GAVSPWHVLAPDPAVRAEDRAERAELEPARVELAGLGHGMKEAAHVGAPVRDAREPRVEPERHLCLERRKVVVDVAGPARGAEALHPGRPGATKEEHARSGARRRLALGKGLVAKAIVDVVQCDAVAGRELRRGRRAFPAVEPPAPGAEPHE